MNEKRENDAVFREMELQVLVQDETCVILKCENEAGDGIMSTYHILDGIDIMFSDFHISRIESGFHAGKELFCIDHCKVGRLEQQMTNEMNLYLTQGDVFFYIRNNAESHAEFPLGHYHGVSIIFDMDSAQKSLETYCPNFPVKIREIQSKYCRLNKNCTIQKDPGMERIFQDFYTVPAEIRIHWFRVKVLELLLYLNVLSLAGKQVEKPYFYKHQAEKAKAIHRLLTNNLQKHYTLEELSQKFSFPMSAMKNTFKAIYGDSIFSYMRSYRMNQAAVMLRQRSDLTIFEIALLVGYETPGKFSTAFKAELGTTPTNYRNNGEEEISYEEQLD